MLELWVNIERKGTGEMVDDDDYEGGSRRKKKKREREIVWLDVMKEKVEEVKGVLWMLELNFSLLQTIWNLKEAPPDQSLTCIQDFIIKEQLGIFPYASLAITIFYQNVAVFIMGYYAKKNYHNSFSNSR